MQLGKCNVPLAPESSYPGVAGEPGAPCGITKTVTVLLSSLVHTCRFWMSKSDGTPFGHQEAVLPPQSIYGTDNVTICKSLLLGMQNRVFGCGIRDWIVKLSTSGLQLLLCIWSADYASANLNVLDVVKALLLVRDATASCLVWFHFERCGCHQLMRASVTVASVTGEKAAQRSKSKLLRMRKAKENFKSATMREYEQHFELNGVKKSDAELQARAKCIDMVMCLFRTKTSAEHFHGELLDDAKDRAAADAAQLQAMQDFFDFHNNSSPLDQVFSRLEPDGQVSREQAVTEGQRLLTIAQFRTGCPQWNEARMLRYVSCNRWWCRYSMLIPMQAKVWSNFKPSKRVVLAGDGLEKDRAAEDGVRLERARKYCENPRSQAMSLLSYTCLAHVECLVALFFYMASDSIEGNPVALGPRVPLAPPQVPYSLTAEDIEYDAAAAAEQPHAAEEGQEAEERRPGKAPTKKRKVKKKGMNFIVDAVEQFVCELWCMVLGADSQDCRLPTGQRQDQQPSTATLRQIREMTVLFWPGGAGEEQACHTTIDKVMLTVLAEIIFRFLIAHRELPYSSCGVKGAVSSDGQISTALGAAGVKPCCVRNVKPLLDFALAPTAGQTPQQKFRIGHSQWNVRTEPSNIPREKLHAEQKMKSKKSDKDVSSFARQAATDVAARVSRLQYQRGGRALEIVPEKCTSSLRNSLKQDTTRRPHQCGNPMFRWITEHLKATRCLLQLDSCAVSVRSAFMCLSIGGELVCRVSSDSVYSGVHYVWPYHIDICHASPVCCEAGGSKTERKAQRSELAKKWHNEVLLAEKQGYPKLLSLVWSKSKDACGAVNQSRS